MLFIQVHRGRSLQRKTYLVASGGAHHSSIHYAYTLQPSLTLVHKSLTDIQSTSNKLQS